MMRFDSRDDYWTFTTSGAGPVAQLVASLDDQVGAIRATPDPSLAAFEHDDKLELPWLSVVTSAV